VQKDQVQMCSSLPCQARCISSVESGVQWLLHYLPQGMCGAWEAGSVLVERIEVEREEVISGVHGAWGSGECQFLNDHDCREEGPVGPHQVCMWGPCLEPWSTKVHLA
jgi:hypothetical protein